jgi:hypothetical protein
MRKYRSVVLAGVIAAGLAGAAAAASRDTHLMTVPLPDGSVARIEYVGDVAPKVTIAPGAGLADALIGPAGAQFGMFDRWAADLRRQIETMTRQMETATPGLATGVGPSLAGYGSMPAGSTSVTVVTTSNGKDSCTRTTEVTSAGPGKPPKVVSNVSGNCAPAAGTTSKPASTIQPTGSGPISRT